MAAINPAPPSNPPAGPPAPRNHVVISQAPLVGGEKEMSSREKLDSIRAWMIKENLQAFMIGSGDAHQVYRATDLLDLKFNPEYSIVMFLFGFSRANTWPNGINDVNL